MFLSSFKTHLQGDFPASFRVSSYNPHPCVCVCVCVCNAQMHTYTIIHMLYYDFPLADSLRSLQILTKYSVNVFINSFTRYSFKAEMDSYHNRWQTHDWIPLNRILDNGEVFKRWNYVNRWKCCIWEVVGRALVLSLNSVQAWQVYSLLNFDFFYLENRLHHVVPSSLPTVPWPFFFFFLMVA